MKEFITEITQCLKSKFKTLTTILFNVEDSFFDFK